MSSFLSASLCVCFRFIGVCFRFIGSVDSVGQLCGQEMFSQPEFHSGAKLVVCHFEGGTHVVVCHFVG